MNDTTNYSEQTFESIRHINEYGQEFWYARELQTALEYSQWRRFEETIERAKIACESSGFAVSDHFANLFALELLFDTEDTAGVLNLLYSRNDLVAKIYESGLEYKPTSSTKKDEIISYLVENENAFAQKLVKTSALVRYDTDLAECLPFIRSYYCNLH